MASSSPLIRFAALIIAALFLLEPVHAMTCSDVMNDLRPCINYLRTGNGKPPAPCCAGASNLASSAQSPADKQTTCQCIKNTASSIKVKPELAKALPGNCGISLPFEVSPTTDCSKIS